MGCVSVTHSLSIINCSVEKLLVLLLNLFQFTCAFQIAFKYDDEMQYDMICHIISKAKFAAHLFCFLSGER